MKVLLRNTQTGLFYVGPDQWSDDQAEALNFEAPDRALDAVTESKLAAMEVVIHFEQSSFDIPVTIVSAGK